MHLLLSSVMMAGMLTIPAEAFKADKTTGATFLNIPVGASPAALGSAYTALAADAYAPVWNPAGLGFLQGDQTAGQHLSYLESVNYEYLSYVHPMGEAGSHGLGIAVQYLTSGDIAGSNDTGTPTGNFSSRYAAYNLAYGRKIGRNFSLGATAKWISARLDDVSANAYAMDVGGLYCLNDKTRLAATLTNLGTTLTFLDQADSLPMALHLGAAYQPGTRWLFSAEGIYDKTGTANVHIGAQWRPLPSVSLRAGFKTDNLSGLGPIAGFTTGLGLFFWGQEFAYAWAPYGDLGSAQYFSLLLRFGARDEFRKNLLANRTRRSPGSSRDHDSPQLKGPDDETQQLMQLLDETESHFAKARGGEDHL